MRYTTYLFDFDYTLADSSRGIVVCFRNVLQRHGFTEITDIAIKRTIGKTLEESFSILTGITDAEQLEAFRKEYDKEEDQYMSINTRLFADTLPTLHKLKKQGVRIGIISTKYRSRILEFLKIHLPKDWFDIIIGGEDVSRHKPSPEGLLLAIRKLNATPEETLYIGDSTVDAETAAAAGISFIGVTSGMTRHGELARYPHVKIISRLRELTDPSSESSFDNRINHFVKKTKVFLRLLHIRRVRGRITPHASEERCTCLNCGNDFTGRYCNRCGQSRHTPRFVRHSAISNVLSGMTNIDHGFGYTLIELLIRPGYMINDFIAGKRVRYFRPFQTLFVLAAVYIMLVQLIDPGALKEEDDERPILPPREALHDAYRSVEDQWYDTRDSISKKELASIARTLKKDIKRIDSITSKQSALPVKDVGTAEAKTSKATGEDGEEEDDGILEEIIVNHLNLVDKMKQIPFIQSIGSLLSNWAHGNKAVSILCLVPLFALSTQWAFRKRTYNRDYNFVELLFAQTYAACQILLISILYFPFNGKADLDSVYDIPWWLVFILSAWVYKELFRGSWIKTVKRTILMYFYCLLLIILLAVIVLIFVIGCASLYKWMFTC